MAEALSIQSLKKVYSNKVVALKGIDLKVDRGISLDSWVLMALENPRLSVLSRGWSIKRAALYSLTRVN